MLDVLVTAVLVNLFVIFLAWVQVDSNVLSPRFRVKLTSPVTGYAVAARPSPALQKRHRRKTTLITSNLGFSEWGSFLKNKHLTSALIDRLTETSHIINMKNCQTLRGKLDND